MISRTPQQLAILGVCVLLFASGQFHRAAGGVLAPIWAQEFALDPARLGQVIGVVFLATIVAQGPVGAALDQFGPRRVLPLSMLFLAVATLGCIAAEGYASLMAARIGIGIGLASTGIGMYLLIARHFDAAEFGYLNGLMVTLGGIGGLAATYPLAELIARLGWVTVFVGLAGVTALLAGLIAVVTRPGAEEEASRKAAPVSYRAVLVAPGLPLLLALSVVTYAPIVTLTGLWGGPYFADVHGLTLQQTGAILFLLFAATMAAGSVFGWLDKRGTDRRLVVAGSAALSAAALGGLALGAGGTALTAAVLMAISVFAQQFYVPLLAELKERVPDAALGRASALFSILAVGAIPAMQTLFGVLLDWSGGYAVPFGAMALCLTAASAAMAARG
ncbi:MFS transporter [Pseudaestuariivita sp.]|uniref:MFS transporter n=1 Tax=Pseudaestuariivita sp. TaxID=2211669 RepID=UPI004057D74D